MSDESRFVTGQVLAIDGGWSVSDGQIPRREAPAGTAPPNAPGTGTIVRKLANWWVKLTRD
jgi:hypothetical protein